MWPLIPINVVFKQSNDWLKVFKSVILFGLNLSFEAKMSMRDFAVYKIGFISKLGELGVLCIAGGQCLGRAMMMEGMRPMVWAPSLSKPRAGARSRQTSWVPSSLPLPAWPGTIHCTHRTSHSQARANTNTLATLSAHSTGHSTLCRDNLCLKSRTAKSKGGLFLSILHTLRIVWEVLVKLLKEHSNFSVLLSESKILAKKQIYLDVQM